MTVDTAPVQKTRVADESTSDFDDACEIKSMYHASEEILSSSSSSSEEERGEVENIDDGSDSENSAVLAEMGEGANEGSVTESGKIKEYDRETILHQLASIATLEGKGQMVLDVIGLKFGSEKWKGKVPTTGSSTSGNMDVEAKERHESLVEDLRETFKPVPNSIMHFATGWFRPGDCGRPVDQKPDWFDVEKFRRGQKFANDNMFAILYAEMVSLLAIFAFDDGLKPLIHSGKSGTPYTALKRYLSTVARMRHWYTQDPWMQGTVAWKDILVVRAMHGASRRSLNSSTIQEIDAKTVIPKAWCPGREIILMDFSETCQVPVIGQCPFIAGRNNPNRPKGISQTEMAVTQWTFAGLITILPKGFGIHHATDEDLEAFCHMWRVLGYQLGMEDEYNLCRGTLEEVQQRSRDFLESWVKPNFRDVTPEWEHMGRCLISGLTILLPLATFETALLHLLEIMGLQMPRLCASLSYKDWFLHNLRRVIFDYALKLRWVASLLSKGMILILDRAEKYTPEQFEAIRIKLSKYPVKDT